VSFDVAAEAYDAFMGRWSRLLSTRLADFAEVRTGQRVLDVGCGTGALASELVARLGHEHVSAVDPSDPFVAAMRAERAAETAPIHPLLPPRTRYASRRMGTHRFTVHINAPPEQVFDLWTNLERAHEWIGGLTGHTDLTGPMDQVGTRYTARFGAMSSPNEVVEVERPRVFRTRFGNRLLAGESGATFEPQEGGTRLTQEFVTRGAIPAIAAWIFSIGSYRGSFRGELNVFARIAERERS
jgi:uncharacterized protein YndB with AHSA1/START domain